MDLSVCGSRLLPCYHIDFERGNKKYAIYSATYAIEHSTLENLYYGLYHLTDNILEKFVDVPQDIKELVNGHS